MGFVDIVERMRSDWNRRAKEDAYFYAAFARRQQSDQEFFASAADTIPTLEKELFRLPASPSGRRALEIGSGPGRLMGPMSRHFAEIHGVDISEEMIELARERLRSIPNARLHVTPGSDLAMFGDDSFDFAYSYTVFQHIPSRDVVLNYLRESRRVLKPGGILCCQLRGTPPLNTELERELETWTGCHFTRDEMLAFARQHDFQLVAISGLETQYMWTTWRKPASAEPRNFTRTELKNVTISSGSDRVVPQRGREACVSLWVDGLPQNCDLSDFEVRFAEIAQRGAFLSPVAETGAGQLNARVPAEVKPGLVEVSLIAAGQPIPAARHIEIAPVSMEPGVVTVTDAIHIGSKFRVETGGLKVTLEGVERPGEISFHIQGREAEIVQTEYKDPILEKYEYSFYLPKKTTKGRIPLIIRASGRELASVGIEIA
ncbi:MAG TPA: class I SAM-dependent methyltransferase [Bryobacteraceae bacterium]|nr:class I SAM-dependent methyltransferase [Bryobacteraceae bacterium]